MTPGTFTADDETIREAVTLSGCSGAAPGNGGGEVGYAPTYRPTQGPGGGDDS